MNYVNVAYDLLTYKMESATPTIDSNSKCCCHPTYSENTSNTNRLPSTQSYRPVCRLFCTVQDLCRMCKTCLHDLVTI